MCSTMGLSDFGQSKSNKTRIFIYCMALTHFWLPWNWIGSQHFKANSLNSHLADNGLNFNIFHAFHSLDIDFSNFIPIIAAFLMSDEEWNSIYSELIPWKIDSELSSRRTRLSKWFKKLRKKSADCQFEPTIMRWIY